MAFEYIPKYRVLRVKAGIRSDKELAREAGLNEQRLILWVSGGRGINEHEIKAVSGVLGCPVTDIWDRETGRPIPAA